MSYLLAPFFPSRRSRSGPFAARAAGTPMRQALMLALATVVFAAAAPNAEAYYNVTIGNTDTAGAWAGNVWTPNGTGSTVSAGTIQSKLATGAVTINTGTSTDGGTEAGDITVSSAVSWDANTLTLTANVLNINAVMTAGGSAGLAVNVSGYFDGTSGSQVVTMINTGMGSGGFIGRVDFTGSNNTISFNGTPGVIITTLGEEGIYCNDNSLQGSDKGFVIHVLGADIDATPTASWNNGLGFMPFGFFTCGIASRAAFPLDGLGHTIDGLTINRPTMGFVGLFESVYYMAQNIGLTNVNIVGGWYVGALGGINGDVSSPNGRIANVFVTGSVTATGQTPYQPGITYVGGLLGHNNPYNARLSMTNVYSDANVTGIDFVGGLLGGFKGYPTGEVTLDGAYTTGTVNGRYEVGALIGTYQGSSGGDITNVYTTATVNAPGSASGMIGGAAPGGMLTRVGLGYFDGQMNLLLCYPVSSDILIVDHLYHNSETVHLCGGSNVTVPDPGYSAPLTNAQMKQQASYVGFDFNNTWVIDEGQTTPILRSMEGLFDSDGDGYYNNEDAFPVDAAEWLDTDGDGIGNNADTDDDGDGVLDVDDAFPLDATESLDTDGDGIGNNADSDDDGDGVPDVDDAFPLDATESLDTDGDGIGNNADTDDDNDGVLDGADAFPLDATESVDTDDDGIGNNADTDDDNDGVLDTDDAFPLDATRSSVSSGGGGGGGAFNPFLLLALLGSRRLFRRRRG